MLAKQQRMRVGFAVVALAMAGAAGIGRTAGNTATAAESPNPSTSIADYVASKLDDFTATMKIAQYDEKASLKINKDFGLIYQLKSDVKVRYKEENKYRADARVKTSNLTYILNGTRQHVRWSPPDIKDTRDLGNEPGKRKTLLDVGLISSAYLAYTRAEFKRTQPVDGVNCAVFRISYRDQNLDTSHRLVWIDPTTRVTLKREEYTQEGKLSTTWYYRNPKQVAPGIWFPSRIEVYNNEGQKAGTTLYTDVKVNQGLDDSIFKW
jgi:outer membrane lipoprotein-sorting protein